MLNRTTTPLSLVITTSPTPLPLDTTTTVYELLLLTTTCAADPANTTLLIALPPPNSPLPVMVTRTPACPASGVTVLICPREMYVNAFARVNRAPLANSTSTAPLVFSPQFPTSTTICPQSALCTAAAYPTNVTDTTASNVVHSVPIIVTCAPPSPLAGRTLLIIPGTTYVHDCPETIAPLSATRTTLPLVCTIGPTRARTTTRLSFWLKMSASSPASHTRTTALPLPRSLSPAIDTRVPHCPDVGVTDDTCPTAAYSHPEAKTARAPVLPVTTTLPTPAALLNDALTTTRVSDCERIVATTPPSVTLTTDTPYP